MACTYCLTLDVRGALELRDAKLAGHLTHADGRPMSAAETRDVLRGALAEGARVIPAGVCDGWDAATGCPGHRVPEGGR